MGEEEKEAERTCFEPMDTGEKSKFRVVTASRWPSCCYLFFFFFLLISCRRYKVHLFLSGPIIDCSFLLMTLLFRSMIDNSSCI